MLYLNGDLGDVAPNPPPGDTPLRQAILMGERLGDIALNAVQAATPQADVTLRARCRTIPMPPALLESLAPREAVLQDFSFGGALFLSLPGEVTTPIGLALRAEAQKVGVRHTFLCGLTSSYNGYYPDATEYFRAQYESQMDLYGAELTGWFLKNLFPDDPMTQEQCWQSDPLLNAHFATFRAAYARGRLHQRVIRKHWARTRMQIHGVIDTMKRFKVMPAAVKSYEKFVDRDGLKMLGTAFFSYLAREQLVTSMTDEQRVTMMGLADGAQLPLDALMIEQYLRHPRNLPHIARFVLGLTGVTGSDLLARYGSAVPPKYVRHSKVRQAHKKINAESESIS